MTINGEMVDITAKDSATFDGQSGNDIGRALGQQWVLEVCLYQQVEYLQTLLEKTI